MYFRSADTVPWNFHEKLVLERIHLFEKRLKEIEVCSKMIMYIHVFFFHQVAHNSFIINYNLFYINLGNLD